VAAIGGGGGERVYRSTDNVDGGTGPRAERRLRGRGALRQSAGWGLLRIELAHSLHGREKGPALCGSLAAATATAVAAAASAPASEKSKQKHARRAIM